MRPHCKDFARLSSASRLFMLPIRRLLLHHTDQLTLREKMITLRRSLDTFFLQPFLQRSDSIPGFEDPMVSVAMTQLCSGSTNAANRLVTDQAWLGSNKTLFTKTGRAKLAHAPHWVNPWSSRSQALASPLDDKSHQGTKDLKGFMETSRVSDPTWKAKAAPLPSPARAPPTSLNAMLVRVSLSPGHK